MDYRLTFNEGRVLGVLIEKRFTTPEQFPLSLNSCTLGCNQKTSRDPVTNLSEGEVLAAIENLQMLNIVVRHHLAGSRVEKYSDALARVSCLGDDRIMVLATLLLRGDQTPGELSARCKRALPDISTEAVDALLNELRQTEQPWVQRLERQPGQKEVRWRQLLTEVSPDLALAPGGETAPRMEHLENEIASMRDDISELRRQLAKLREALGVAD